MNQAARWIRLFVLLSLLLLVVPEAVYARLLCRSDPKVYLTNGVRLDIGASINAAQSDIIVVNYELHVPVGVGMTKAEHTLGWSDVNETFTLIADQAPNQYNLRTTVRARTGTPTFTSYINVKYQGQTQFTTTTTSRTATTSFSSASR